MPRPKGSQNKITTEVKEQLQNLIDTVMNRVDADSMTADQKLKLLQLSLHPNDFITRNNYIRTALALLKNL